MVDVGSVHCYDIFPLERIRLQHKGIVRRCGGEFDVRGTAFVVNYTPRVLSPQMYDKTVIPKSRSENFRFPTYLISCSIGK